MQIELPSDELEPGEQPRHVNDPFSAEYVPAAHALHEADPVDALNHPATHAVHRPPSGPDDPALQVQFLKTALPTGEFEFDGQAVHVELAEAPTAVEYFPVPQSVHAADPVDALYLPASQAVQLPPSGPE